MASQEKFYSITREEVAELIVKSSRFIAHAAPVEDEKQAQSYIDGISERFHNATHHCFAYKLGTGDQALIRFRDAGEPSGTAGRPILQAIESKDMTNVVIVVTRYFGGTKLGTGGLMRAYGGVAQEVLEKCGIVEYTPQTLLSVEFPYPLADAVHQILDKFNGHILDTEFQENSVYTVKLSAASVTAFRAALKDVSSGKIKVEQFHLKK